MKRLTASITCIALLAGCASPPRGAGYVPLVDMKGQDEAAFATDVRECQAYARQRMDAVQGAMAGAIAGALLGALVAPRGHRNYVATRTGSAGALAGGAAANENQESITKRCLAGRGYNVLN